MSSNQHIYSLFLFEISHASRWYSTAFWNLNLAPKQTRFLWTAATGVSWVRHVHLFCKILSSVQWASFFMNRLLPSVIKRSILVNSRLHSTMAQSFLVTKNMDTKYFEKVANKFTMDMWQHSHDIPRQDLLERVKGKTAIFCTLTDKIDGQLLDAAGPQLKVVSTLSAGYDHIDLDECRKRNILVANTPDVLTDAVAELTISLLLATLRRLFEANRALRE